jgi:hypothetical protein
LFPRHRYVLAYLTIPEPVQPGDALSFRDFILFFTAVSTQAFNDANPENRVDKLFEVCKNSGGPGLIARADQH